MSESSQKIKFTVSAVQNGQATLETTDGQRMTITLAALRGDIQVGDVLYAVFTETEEEKTVRDMAKETLNELLHVEDTEK